MMKLLGLGSSLPETNRGVILAILALMLAGCQSSSVGERELHPEGWRVLERIGDARQGLEAGFENTPIWPGGTISEARQVTTGRGASLILARGGIQITVGESTSLRLPADLAASSLLLDRGWLRLRLNTAVSGTARIKTAQFDINGTRTTLTLSAGQEGTDLLVEAGRATLTTIDGRHHATLVAGAAARIDQAPGSDLWIRPAKGRAFAKAAPLAADAWSEGADEGSLASKDPEALTEIEAQPTDLDPHSTGPRLATDPKSSGNSESAEDQGLAQAPVTTETAIIRPASRLNTTDAGLPMISSPNGPTDLSSPSPITAKAEATPAMALPGPGLQSSLSQTRLPARPTTMPAMSEDTDEASDRTDDMWPVDPPLWQAETSDPVQTKFNRLTEGLVDGL